MDPDGTLASDAAAGAEVQAQAPEARAGRMLPWAAVLVQGAQRGAVVQGAVRAQPEARAPLTGGMQEAREAQMLPLARAAQQAMREPQATVGVAEARASEARVALRAALELVGLPGAVAPVA